MQTTSTPQEKQFTSIRPSSGWVPIHFGELWAYRELLYFLIWRNIKVRYKQTVLGAAWAIIQPLFSMIVFTLFFGELANIPSDGIPYPVFSYAALVPWTFFATSLTSSSDSLVGNAQLITKVYFPRLFIPLAATLGGIVDFMLSFGVLLLLMAGLGIAPTINVVFLPLFLLLTVVTALGIGLWLTATNVQFRDVRYIVPFIVQMWLFITPVVYPTSLIENDILQALYSLNPMVGVIEGFRWALLDVDTAPSLSILISAVTASVLFISGIFYFRRMEKIFADVI